MEDGGIFPDKCADVIFAGIFAAGVIIAVPEFSVPVDRVAMEVGVDHFVEPFRFSEERLSPREGVKV